MILSNLKSKNENESENLQHQSKYVDSYIKLTKERVIFLNEVITKEVSSSVCALLLYFDSQNHDKDITIFINSDGGDAAALAAMYDVIQMIQSPVKTICLGKCYSAAAILLAIGSKGKRYALKNSQIMIHGLQCTFPILGENDSKSAGNYLEFLNSLNVSVMKMLSKHTGKDLDIIHKDCLRDFYMDSKQALEYGVIDEIL